MTENSEYGQANGTGPPDPPGGLTTTTEERLRLLESQVQTLAQAVRALAQGLEEPPTQETSAGERHARGARLAHELLLAQGM